MAVLDRGEGARFLRRKAEQLRALAIYSAFFAPSLLQTAQELEERAELLEQTTARSETPDRGMAKP